MIIAIDGLGGSGKGTLAKALATKYNLAVLETGLLYRAVALHLLTTNGDIESPSIPADLNLSLLSDPRLRNDDVAQIASKIAVIPKIREALNTFQRNFAYNTPDGKNGVILDGRDIGTVICPDADHKFFLIASHEVRAKRRTSELHNLKIDCSYDDVLKELTERDMRDMNRENSPLVPASDSFIIDTSELSSEDVETAAMRYIEIHDKVNGINI